MFGSLSSGILGFAVGLAALGGATCALAFVVTLLMNLWGVLNPRAGAAVKEAMLKIGITAMLFGAVAAVPGMVAAMAGG